MRLYSVTGRLVYKNVSKNLIKWNGKSRSKIQFAVKQFLKQHWLRDICYEEFPCFGTRYKIDFVNATRRIAIEVDGAQHEEFNQHFHNNSRLNYLYSIRRDYKKEEWLEKNNFKVARIKEEEIRGLTPEFFEEKFGFKLV